MKLLIATTSILLALNGCVASKPLVEQQPYLLGENLVIAGYTIADSLEQNLKIDIPRDQSIIVASFVSVDNMTQSSTFGRMLSEYVASRLSQKGYRVIELKLRQNSIFIEEGKGELMLSRDVREIGVQHNAAAVVVGTYGSTKDLIYVSARVVLADTSAMVSSCDYAIRNSKSQAIASY